MAGKLPALWNNRWLVLVATMWLQSMAGVGYIFGSLSPVIKAALGYNQRQIAAIGVAKDLGDSLGFFAGVLSARLPVWGMILVGAANNFLGYGWLWLVVTARLPAPPLWAMCVIIFVGTNGETYFNTAALMTCVQNFPRNRGPIVGILKAFAGLTGAILTQIYMTLNTPDHAALVFMVAVGPTMVAVGLMFVIRVVAGEQQRGPSDAACFSLVYSVCLLVAAYLVGVMIVQDVVELSNTVTSVFTTVLVILLLVPLAAPVISIKTHSAFIDPPPDIPAEPPRAAATEEQSIPEPLTREGSMSSLPDEVPLTRELSTLSQSQFLSEVEDERPDDIDGLSRKEKKQRLRELEAQLLLPVAQGGVAVRRRRGPRRGEDFTMAEALVKADFWLLYASLLLGSGSGLTVIDNLGQMSQSAGYADYHVFVSLISIFNFLGRFAGGYISEVIIRKYIYPRHGALAAAQLAMALGHVLLALAWPGTMYAAVFIVGVGYGFHWAIVPAAASEIFGLKSFGAMYNVLTTANPAGSLIFSGLIASNLYDYEAARQAHNPPSSLRPAIAPLVSFLGGGDVPLKCDGYVCFFVSSLIMAAFCIVAAALSLVFAHRTRPVYRRLYVATDGPL